MVTRKRFGFGLIALAVLALGGVAVAGESEVINLTGSGSGMAGESYTASVIVNQAPMSVTFTSSPAGLVNYTTTVNTTSATVSVPTNGSAGGGTYSIVATPSAGGASKSKTVVIAPGT
jgi:hypothetical protein